MKFKQRLLAACTAVLTLLAVMTVPAHAVPETTSSEAEGETMLYQAIASSKNETVYTDLSLSGEQGNTVVSVYLENQEDAYRLEDVSELENISLVSSEISFEQEGEHFYFEAEGEPVLYQGTTTKSLPIGISLSYTLDGQPIEPDELLGKSGRLSISVSLENRISETMEIDGETCEIYAPFTVMAYATLDDSFSDIEGENIHLQVESGTSLFTAVCFPGLAQSLGLENTDRIPSDFTLTAQVMDCELPSITFVIMSDLLEQLDLSFLDELLQQAEDAQALVDAGAELSGGAGDMTSGVQQFQSGIHSLSQGADELSSGLESSASGSNDLAAGAGELSSGLDAFSGGLQEAAGSVGQLKDASGQLAQGAEELANALNEAEENGSLDIDTEALQTILNQLSALYDSRDEIEAAIAANQSLIDELSADPANTAVVTALQFNNSLLQAIVSSMDSTGLDDPQQALEQFFQSLANTSSYLSQLQTGLNELAGGLAALDSGVGELQSGLSALSSNSVEIVSGVAELYAGLDSLSSGLGQMSAGSRELAGGIDTLSNSSAQLLQGANALKEGVADYTAAIDELVTEYSDRITNINGRKNACLELGQEYDNFSGLIDGCEGTVRFLAKTPELTHPPAPIVEEEEPEEEKGFFEQAWDWITGLFG